jgi:hypothetical protein
MRIDASFLRRFTAEVSGPPELLDAVKRYLLEQMTKASLAEERRFAVRYAAELLPLELSPWSKAEALREEMVIAMRTAPRAGESGLRPAARHVVALYGRPLSVRQIYRILAE